MVNTTYNSYVIEKLMKLPESFLLSLHKVFNSPGKIEIIEEHLKKYSITFEKNGFQISFNCLEEVYAVKDLFRIKSKLLNRYQILRKQYELQSN